MNRTAGTEGREAHHSRLRAGLRRHGLAPRPGQLRQALGRRGLRFSDGNRVDLYDCGRSAFPVMLEAIARARDFVHLETYILRADRIGSKFIDALTERARAGVEVRLLYDSVGCHELDPSRLSGLRDAGASVLAFNPLGRLYPRWAPRRRDHRKILLVDGTQAFTGGLNIGDEYDTGPVDEDGRPGWRDTHARIAGPATRDLGAVFLESWFRADGAELPWHQLLDSRPEAEGAERCGVLPDGPVYRRRAMRDLLVSALGGAESTARLASAYFAPDGRVLEALEDAAERGVRVELMLAGLTDHPILRRGARSTVERLLRSGARIYEYDAAILHAKSAVFDGRLSIIGSSNLDRQSFQHNYEVNLVAVGGGVSDALDAFFERDLLSCSEITLESLQRRRAWTRAVDGVAAAVIRWFV